MFAILKSLNCILIQPIGLNRPCRSHCCYGEQLLEIVAACDYQLAMIFPTRN